MEFRNVTVVGMARSGVASAQLLLEMGANVLLYDAKSAENFGEDVQELLKTCKNYLGADAFEAVRASDMLVLSPGVPTKLPFIQYAYELGKKVIAEIELGFHACKGDFVCISGTNGKTTTTALTGEIFKNSGRGTHVLGNIGLPITQCATMTRDADVIVAETAALQLETIHFFRAKAGAILNISEDHLDRFGDMHTYTDAKLRLFENQTEDDFSVLNFDDPVLRASAFRTKGRLLWFSRSSEVESGAFVRDGNIIFKFDGKEQKICPASDVKIPGVHNLENALAAVCLSLPLGVSASTVAHTLRTFAGVEHRIEFVAEKSGVRYINDSKGTNPDATLKAIAAMTRPTVLILGGYDKHSEFEELFEGFNQNIRHIVLLGETKHKIAEAAQRAGYKNVSIEDTFEEVILKCAKTAQDGWNVLLSPACASWDMFRDFEQRGEEFKRIVNKLK